MIKNISPWIIVRKIGCHRNVSEFNTRWMSTFSAKEHCKAKLYN